MALDSAGLAGDLNTLFSAPPDTINACASDWASALNSYASAIIPASTTVTAASNALGTTLQTTFSNNDDPAMLVTLEANFKTWAAAIGTGMVGYNSVPPAGNIGFSGFADQASHGGAALVWTVAINAWMITGVSTLILFPFTVVIWN